ncbi:MAG: ABC transporter permease subunit [Pseudomonadota bacterium]
MYDLLELSLLRDIGISSLRWLIGLSLGSIAGLILSIICAWDKGQKTISPLVYFLRSIPILGLVPLIQWYFGPKELGKVLLISWAVIFPIWISFVSVLQRNEDQDSALAMLGPNSSAPFKLRHFFLPKLGAAFISGINLAVGLGWLAVVASELVGTFNKGFWAGGLGYRLFDAFNTQNDWRSGLLCIALFGVLGLTTSWLWSSIAPYLYSITTGGDARYVARHTRSRN